MRIAVIEPIPLGGLLHYATQLADALAADGHDVDLVVARDNELASRQGPARRVAVLPPDPPPAPADPTRAQTLERRARTALRLVRTWRRIIGVARSRRYDAVLLNGSFDMVLNAGAGLLLTAAKGRVPLAHVCHNVRPFNRWGGDSLFVDSGPTLALLGRMYPRFDLLFVHGERSRDEYRELYPPTRLAVIPHGDEGVFADGGPPPPAEEPRILFFGAWRKMKGLSVLMPALDELAARRPEVRVTLAGPTVPEEGVSDIVLAWAAERSDWVEVRPGYVPIEDVRELFGRARVVVMPYLAGYQSGVVHLAMTMERAVVATDVGDLPTAVEDGVSGVIVPADDPGALAAALALVALDPALAARLGAAGGAAMAGRSSWSAVAKQVAAALEPLTAGGGAA